MPHSREYTQLINTARWQRLRRQQLNKRPLCQECERQGLVTVATEVHHTTPIEYGLTMADKERLAFDPHNLQSLCHRCHIKAHEQLGRSGKAAAKRITQERLKDIRRKYLPPEVEQ